jgi:hypothetical protein
MQGKPGRFPHREAPGLQGGGVGSMVPGGGVTVKPGIPIAGTPPIELLAGHWVTLPVPPTSASCSPLVSRVLPEFPILESSLYLLSLLLFQLRSSPKLYSRFFVSRPLF